MHDSTKRGSTAHGSARRSAATLALLIVASAPLAGCAAPGAAPSTAPPSPSGAAPTPAATPGATATDDPDASVFTTQNGTASFSLPAGWSVVDHSVALPNHDSALQWMNQLGLVDDRGRELLQYTDGAIDDAGWADPQWATLEERPIAGALRGELAATTWWVSVEGQPPMVFAEVAQRPAADEPPYGVFFEVEGRIGFFRADLAQLEPCAAVADIASAEACLRSDETLALLDVLETLELHDVPWSAMPEEGDAGGDAGALDPGAVSSDEPWRFATHDGAVAVDLPAGWSAAETVRGEPAGAAYTLGTDFVTFRSPSGTRLELSDRSGDDAAIAYERFAEVERRTAPNGQVAVAWWGEAGGAITAGVRLAAADGSLVRDASGRTFQLWLADVPPLGSAAEAEGFLAGPQAQEALAVLATTVVQP